MQVRERGRRKGPMRNAARTVVIETLAAQEEVVSSRCGPASPIHNREVCIARRVA